MTFATFRVRGLVVGGVLVLGALAAARQLSSPSSPAAPGASSPGAMVTPPAPVPVTPEVRPGQVKQLSPGLLLDEQSRLWSYLRPSSALRDCLAYDSTDGWTRTYRSLPDAVAVAPLSYPDGLCYLDATGNVRCGERAPRPREGSLGHELCWRGLPWGSGSEFNAAQLVGKPGQPTPLDPLCQDASFVSVLDDVQEITGVATSHRLSDYARDGSGQSLPALGVTPTCALRREGTLLCWTSLARSPYPVPTPPAWGKVTHLQISDFGQLVISTDKGHVASSLSLLRELEADPRVATIFKVRRPGQPIRFQKLFQLQGASLLAAGAEVCAAQAQGEVWCTRQVPSFRQGSYLESSIGTIPARKMKGLQGVRSLSSNDNHSCAVDAEGQLRCWGLRAGMPPVLPEDDQEENQRTRDYFEQPVRVKTRGPARLVAVLAHDTCVALEDDSLQCLDAGQWR